MSQLKTIVFSGVLTATEQEGGFCSSEFTIDNKSLDKLIAEAFGLEVCERGSILTERFDSIDIGQVTITIDPNPKTAHD